ncbi:MAG TPA: NADPH:quinone reductase [Pirellulaceae bacterium]|jgi:NADPH2:quinone reductase|nr:NADPH:quinone reductase [Pirellulaceae bacterium]
MKAAYIERTGPPDAIQYGELPDPKPGPGQVLVRMRACAVNPIDTYIRGGAIAAELPLPFVVGCDLAGTVESVGENASRFKPGERVWCSNQGLLGRQGTFAELCAIDEKFLYPICDGVDFEAAAASALVGITAHLGLFREAHLKPGETIFVQGGSGGVGSTVVQMAKAAAARIFATAGSDEKVAYCRELGADEAVNYKTTDVAAAFKEFAPGGAQVFWETQREPDFDFIVGCMAERGRVVLMAGRDARPAFPVGPFYVKGLSLHGFVMFKATPEEMRICSEDINQWLRDKQLRPLIGKRLTLAEAAEAHRLQEESTVSKSGGLHGKIVLTPT